MISMADKGYNCVARKGYIVVPFWRMPIKWHREIFISVDPEIIVRSTRGIIIKAGIDGII